MLISPQRYGQELGPVEGVGYINELIARLTSTPVNDTTQTNFTLDHSPLTFPLNRTLYADFSHDDQMIAIYSAMGLFQQPEALNPTSPNSSRTWVASQLVPFSAKMVVERLHCQFSASVEPYLRILVNEAIQPLEFCSGVTADGVCSVKNFVASQTFSTSGGDGKWAQCFE